VSRNPYLADDGNGWVQNSNCDTSHQTPVTGNNPADAHVPLKDHNAGGDPVGTVYRDEWVAALATDFGAMPHFYDMDNEMDIWGGTHRDVHPNPTGYEEMRDTYITEARNLKTWDSNAVRFGPVSCCWWFYWQSAVGNADKAAHGNVDLLPWWLNEVYWRDNIDSTRSLDVFDIHAYPDPPDNIQSASITDQRKAAVRIYRDYWDPTYTSESGTINQPWATSIQPLGNSYAPNGAIPFRIPRIRAMLNMTYPNTPLSITEWSAEFAGSTSVARAADFSTALGDADAFGILGRERVTYATRWTAADSANPNYLALKLYRNFDGNHSNNSTFGTTSISATHNADPNLFSVYASLSQTGVPLRIMVINKDPANAAQVTFTLNHFTTGGTVTKYMLSQASPTSIVVASQPWAATQVFPPYSATLLVVTGAVNPSPVAEWDLNPDTIQVPAGGPYTLSPYITFATGGSGTAVTLNSAQFDSGSVCSSHGGTMAITTAHFDLTPLSTGAIAVNPGTAPGFCHFTVTGTDNNASGGVTQTQGGWIVVGNPAATLTNPSPSSGPAGTQVPLSITLNPGSSIGPPVCGTPPCGPSLVAGASVLFKVDSGSLSGGVYGNATQQIATANGSGIASVTLTLPAAGTVVHVTAEGPYALGHPVIPFTVAAN